MSDSETESDTDNVDNNGKQQVVVYKPDNQVVKLRESVSRVNEHNKTNVRDIIVNAVGMLGTKSNAQLCHNKNYKYLKRELIKIIDDFPNLKFLASSNNCIIVGVNVVHQVSPRRCRSSTTKQTKELKRKLDVPVTKLMLEKILDARDAQNKKAKEADSMTTNTLIKEVGNMVKLMTKFMPAIAANANANVMNPINPAMTDFVPNSFFGDLGTDIF
jgi:hypothetical protein